MAERKTRARRHQGAGGDYGNYRDKFATQDDALQEMTKPMNAQESKIHRHVSKILNRVK